MVVAIPSQKALLMCPYISSGKFSVHAPRCSRALLHNLQLTSDRCLICASHLATGMIPAIAIISPLLLTKSGLLTKSIDGGGKSNDGVS